MTLDSVTKYEYGESPAISRSCFLMILELMLAHSAEGALKTIKGIMSITKRNGMTRKSLFL